MENTYGKRLYEVAEIQLSYRSDVKPSLRPTISGSNDAYNVLFETWDSSKIEFVEQFKTKEERRTEFRRLRDISDEASFVAFIFVLKKSFNDGSTAAKNAVDTFRDLHVDGFKIGSKLFSGRNKNVLQGDVLAETLVASIKDSRVRALIQKSTYLSEIVEEYKKVISIRPNG